MTMVRTCVRRWRWAAAGLLRCVSKSPMLTHVSGDITTVSSQRGCHTASVAVRRTSHNNEFIRAAVQEDDTRRGWAADDLSDRRRQQLNALTSAYRPTTQPVTISSSRSENPPNDVYPSVTIFVRLMASTCLGERPVKHRECLCDFQ